MATPDPFSDAVRKRFSPEANKVLDAIKDNKRQYYGLQNARKGESGLVVKDIEDSLHAFARRLARAMGQEGFRNPAMHILV